MTSPIAPAMPRAAAVDNDIGQEYDDPDISVHVFKGRLAMRAFVLVALTAAIPSTAAAQFDAGQISGFVRDAQQAAIPGATVTVTNERNADHRTTVTNSTGYYVLPNIPVGSYA